MGYLVCERCGNYYELQGGEFPEDYTNECDCSGKLVYQESLDAPKKSSSLFLALIIIFTLVLGVLGVMFLHLKGYTMAGSALQLMITLPAGMSMGYLILSKISLWLKIRVIASFSVFLTMMTLFSCIGAINSDTSGEITSIASYFDAVNAITFILLIMGL